MALELLALTVTEVTRRIKHSLESSFSSVVVQGQISNFRKHSSGHIYFTLKDEASQISAVLWRSRTHVLSFVPEDGIGVIVTGRLTLYEVRGVYQIEVSSIRPLGVGELQVAFEYLKRKLSAEGLFDPEHKRQLPRYPERIGIITSSTGAALHDILNILRRRFPAVEVVLRPTLVQGSGAADDITEAIADLNAVGEIDVILLARGGGSIEDLWAFNEERVARAIFASQTPIVSAVGHEIDFTIADFVSDLRAPTPSAAAELVVRDREAIVANVRDYWYTIHETTVTMLKHHKERVRNLLHTYSFNKPIDLLRKLSQRVDELDRELSTTLSHQFALLQFSATALHRRVLALNPELALRRGYAIVYKGGGVVDSAGKLDRGDEIDIKFRDGTIPAKTK
jgi:exodeoxyribonuclease VII large subunit